MTSDDVLSALESVFCEVLDLPALKLTPTTTAADVEEWDSLVHIELIAAIEERFKVKFTYAEMQGFRNVGEMQASILKKLDVDA